VHEVEEVLPGRGLPLSKDFGNRKFFAIILNFRTWRQTLV
jgi:hypothetical protein